MKVKEEIRSQELGREVTKVTHAKPEAREEEPKPIINNQENDSASRLRRKSILPQDIEVIHALERHRSLEDVQHQADDGGT